MDAMGTGHRPRVLPRFRPAPGARARAGRGGGDEGGPLAPASRLSH
jgi:hypothetical protein